MITPKTLYVMRHAKAEAGSAHQEDHLRKLAPRGLSDAALVGAWLVGQGIMPDRVLCSTAVRTAETLVKLEEAYRRPLPVKYVDALYHASPDSMLGLIAATEETVRKLMIVGHNPGLHQLGLHLAAQGEPALIDQLAMKLPTAAFFAIECGPVSWSGLPHAQGKLVHYVTPEMLGGGKE